MSARDRIQVAFRGRLGAFDLDAAFNVPASGVTGVFGPSGCGKTSLLRCIAGLQRSSEGYCSIAGEVWQDQRSFRPPHRRPIGYIFQEASLFAHLSVRRNLAYGMQRERRGGGPGIAFDELVALLGLEALLERSPRHLSGGERQRVALGRALLSQPRLLLLDEPLSALDHQTRNELLPYLEQLHQRLSLPMIYVSHELAELERFADQLVLMAAGRVLAAGPLQQLQSDPALPLARARHAAVTLDAVVEKHDAQYGLLTLAVDGDRLLVPADRATVGERRRVRVAADDVSVAAERPLRSSILNVLPARIASVSELAGNELLLLLGLGHDGAGARLLARVTRRSWEQLQLDPGALVYAQIKGVALAPSELHFQRWSAAPARDP